MKRILIIVFLLFSFSAYSQVKLGIKISPSLILNRVKAVSDTASIVENGIGIRPSFGLIAEIPFEETYAFSTGITYLSKTVRLKIDPINSPAFLQEYVVQYIQIPITIKLFTNEISIDKKLYFQTGFNMEFQVYNENKTDGEDAIEKFSVFDFPIVFSGGAEINLGTHTILFFGMSYQRGMINISHKENFANKNFSVKNDALGFDIGLKF